MLENKKHGPIVLGHIEAMRTEFSSLTEFALGHMGQGKAAAMFITKIEEAMFWGEVALGEKDHSKIEMPKNKKIITKQSMPDCVVYDPINNELYLIYDGEMTKAFFDGHVYIGRL